MRIVLVISIMLLCSSCGVELSRGFNSTDEQEKKQLADLFVEKGIKHRVGEDGTIYYSSSDENKVNEIKEIIREKESLAISTKYDDLESKDYLIKILTSRGLEYREEKRGDGEWVTWYPNTKEQDGEIHMLVVEHKFNLMHEKRLKQ